MKVVLDTNIWISALLAPRSTPGRIVFLVRLGLLQAVSSPVLWKELHRAAGYSRVRKQLERQGLWEATQEFLKDRPNIFFVEASDPLQNWLPSDPADNHVIQCALTTLAEKIVTGDKALLHLKQVEGCRIVSPRQFLNELEEMGIVFE